jgi:hypothetical protein
MNIWGCVGLGLLIRDSLPYTVVTWFSQRFRQLAKETGTGTLDRAMMRFNLGPRESSFATAGPHHGTFYCAACFGVRCDGPTLVTGVPVRPLSTKAGFVSGKDVYTGRTLNPFIIESGVIYGRCFSYSHHSVWTEKRIWSEGRIGRNKF